MSNIKIQFICEPSKYNTVKDKKVWVDIFKELQILKRTVEVKEGNWIEKIVREFQNYNKTEDMWYVETEDVLIVRFNRIEISAGEGETQELCCKQFENIPENIQEVLKKFGVNDYYLTCDFIAEENSEEELYELLKKICSQTEDESSCELEYMEDVSL